jgi:hypothetical protein
MFFNQENKGGSIPCSMGLAKQAKDISSHPTTAKKKKTENNVDECH